MSDPARTYGSIEPAPGGWLVTDLEPHVSRRFKQIFPRIKATARPPFLLEGGPNIDADLDWFMQRYPLRMKDGDRERIKERKTLFETQQAELASILSTDWMPSRESGFRPSQKPYGYQAQAAEIARRMGRLLLMDDLGLGKTISAFAAITDKEFLPALIVPQTHLVKQWAAKLREFTHLTSHTFKQMTPYKLPQADVYICPYSKLGGWIDFAEQAGFRSVIFDEMQELRHGVGTDKGRAAREFIKTARLVMGLTATPIYNYGSEIFEIINFLEEGALGSWIEFQIEWCKPGPGGKWLVEDPAALGTYLRERHLALRRTDTDIGHAMPPLNVVTHDVPFDSEVIDSEEALMRDLALRVTTSQSFTDRGQAAREFDMRMREATGIAKAPHVAAFVNLLLEAGEPVLLVGWHRAVYEIWQEKLAKHNPVLFTGTESPTQKEATKAAFVSGKSNLMIMSLRSGAGLDGLQHRARTIVFGELDWSPQVHAQCCGRLRRPGQTRQVDAIYLHTEGGSDPSVMSVLGLKASQSAGIVDPLSAPKDQHSDSTRIRDLAARFLAGRSHVGSAEPPPAPRVVEPMQPALL